MKDYITVVLFIIAVALGIYLVTRKPNNTPTTVIDGEHIVELIDSVVDTRIGCLIESDAEVIWDSIESQSK